MSPNGSHCITMHQPWASLLVAGIKRIEGRSWPSPMTGRLWIHAAAKVPDAGTITAMEDFYRGIYEVDGVTEIHFPEHYPVSVLLGCVTVVDCIKKEELDNWKEVTEGIRLEGQTPYCWLCENPQKLIVTLEMKGNKSVYNLPKQIFEVAPRALRPAQGPAPFTFPPLNDSLRASLQPGTPRSKSQTASSPQLDGLIARAKVASLQYSKPDNRVASTSTSKWDSTSPRYSKPDNWVAAPQLDGLIPRANIASLQYSKPDNQVASTSRSKQDSPVTSPQYSKPDNRIAAPQTSYSDNWVAQPQNSYSDNWMVSSSGPGILGRCPIQFEHNISSGDNGEEKNSESKKTERSFNSYLDRVVDRKGKSHISTDLPFASSSQPRRHVTSSKIFDRAVLSLKR